MTRASCGMRRYEQRYVIRAMLEERGLNMSEIARRLGVSPTIVSSTIMGKRHSLVVLDALKAEGIPDKYLFDPRVWGNRAA